MAHRVGLVVGCILITGTAHDLLAETVGTAFTYQGELVHDGTPVEGTCDFLFDLFDAASVGAQIGGMQVVSGVAIGQGVFTVTLDFGENVFDGNPRWLEISVKCTDPVIDRTLLSPRQAIRPVPYALALPAMRVEQNATSPNVIGGHSANAVTDGAHGATISGGGTGGTNRITDDFGTIGGGDENQAGNDDVNSTNAQYASVAGGRRNQARGRTSTVAGGEENTAVGANATVGGGENNTAAGLAATIAGGEGNDAGGAWSFAGGRMAKVRTATDVVAAEGGHDNDGDEGTFVWADASGNPFGSTGPNQFLIRAGGGVGIGTNDPQEQLDVDGNIRASGTIQSGNSIVVDGVLNEIASSGDLELHVSSGRALRVEANATSPNLIGGHPDNFVEPMVAGATIGGGGGISAEDEENRVRDDFGTVGGGIGNAAGASTLLSRYATVSGGFFNRAIGQFATIGGGSHNTVRGENATVPGGRSNVAGGDFSFAAGRRATARLPGTGFQRSGDDDGDEGTFVWADSTDGDFVSTGPNQFLIRAEGGVGVNTNAPDVPLHVTGGNDTEPDGGGYLVLGSIDDRNLSFDNNEIMARDNGGIRTLFLNSDGGDVGIHRGVPATALHPLHVGHNTSNGNGAHVTDGGAWTNGSDRNSKTNFTQIDKQAILATLAEMPITRWRYKGESDSIEHVGPVAQDFRAAFGLGHSDTHITTVDADGVALAAIQGLHQMVKEKEAELCALRTEHEVQTAQLRQANADLHARLARLEAAMTRFENDRRD